MKKDLDEIIFKLKNSQKIFHWTSYITLIISFIFLVIAAYWIAYPHVPLTLKEPIEVMNKDKTVKAGDVLIYKLEINKHLPIPASICKQIITEISMITLPPIIGNVEVGITKYTYPARIPDYVESGMAKLKWTATYIINPLKRITMIGYSEPFYILNNSLKK